MEIHSQHTAGAQGKLTIGFTSPPQDPGSATPGPRTPQAQAPSLVMMTIPGLQTPQPSLCLGTQWRCRLPWPVIENRMPWTHTAHCRPSEDRCGGGYGVWASSVECPQGAPSFQPFRSTPKPSTHTLGGAAPGIHCLMPVNTPNTSLTAPLHRWES